MILPKTKTKQDNGHDTHIIIFSSLPPTPLSLPPARPTRQGSGPPTGDYSVRLWNTQSYAYRVPLRPALAADGAQSGLSLGHMRGDPKTMKALADYDDVVAERAEA